MMDHRETRETQASVDLQDRRAGAEGKAAAGLRAAWAKTATRVRRASLERPGPEDPLLQTAFVVHQAHQAHQDKLVGMAIKGQVVTRGPRARRVIAVVTEPRAPAAPRVMLARACAALVRNWA